MSARTPFIPNGSASRVTHKNNDQNVDPVSQQALDAQFSLDSNNPLHHSDASSKVQTNYNRPPGTVTDTKATVQPLNLNGFMKKTTALPISSADSARQEHTAHSRRNNPSMDNQILENPLARRDPTVNASLSLVTPIPRLANQSTPLIFPHPRPDSPGTSFKTSASLSSLNQSSSDAENFKLNLLVSKGAPPQRVPVEENLPLLGLIPRNRNKRTRPDEGEDQDPDLVYMGSTSAAVVTERAQVAKRYKPHDQQLDDPSEIDYMRQSFSPQPFSSPGIDPHLLGSEYNTSPKGPTDFHRQQNGDGHGHSSGFLQDNNGKSRASIAETNNSLDRLLGCQTNVYVDDHMARYQQLSSKWQECTMEEWVKGAEEIMAKYSKLLDYVKKHMESKLKLLASFDTQINDHKAVLEGQAKVLDSAKHKLVSNGQIMIGNGASGR